MKKINRLVVLLLLGNACISLYAQSKHKIEGVYEFVSQEIIITKSGNKTINPSEKHLLSSPRWTGLWIINEGYFSSVLMKEERNNFFDCEKRDLAYESFAGTYEVEGNKISFKQNYSLHPFFKGRPISMMYKVNKDILTLYKDIHPTMEEMVEGTMTIILKRK